MEKNGIFNAASSFNKLWHTKILSECWLMVSILKKTCLKKNGAYVIKLDEYADAGVHWVGLFCKRSETVYFDSFDVEYLAK